MNFFNKYFAFRSEVVSIQSQLDISKKEIERLKEQISELSFTLTEPSTYGTISYGDVSSILNNCFPNAEINISDSYFNLTTMEEAKVFTVDTKVCYRKWVAEDHDCDNFSFALMGYWSQGLKSFAFGIAWSAGHAFNFMIDKDKKVWIIEPQTNSYMLLVDAQKNPMYSNVRLVLL